MNVLTRIGSRIDSLLETLMLSLADFQAAVAKVDADIDAVLKQIQDLKDQLAAGGLTPAEEQQVLDAIEALDAKLNPPA